MDATILRVFVAEIAARGGETSITTTPYGCGRSRAYDLPLAAVDERGGLALLRCEGWRSYSRSAPVRRASLAYLVGQDDNGPWAVRVPGTCRTVGDGLDYHVPVEAREAREAGRTVRRQGDVWIVSKSPRGRDDAASGRGLPGSHKVVIDARGCRRLVHEPRPGDRRHRAVYLPAGPVGFAVGRRLETRRGAARD